MNNLRWFAVSAFTAFFALSYLKAEELDWEILKNTEKVADPPQAVLLEYKFDAGVVRQYELTTAGEGTVRLPGTSQSSKLQTTSKLSFRQTAALSGTDMSLWNVKWTLHRGTTKIEGFKEFPVSMPDMEVQIDKHGNVKEIKGLDKAASQYGLPSDTPFAQVVSQLKSPGFPQRKLKPGDLWEREYKVELADGSAVNAKSASQLMGFERVANMDCARIRTTYEVPFTFSMDTGGDEDGSEVFTGTEKGDIWAYFAYGEGKVVLSHGVIEMLADISKAPDPEKETAGEQDGTGAAPASVQIKYHITSQFKGESPRTDTKGEKK